MARISPVVGFMATTVPFFPAKAASAASWMRLSMVREMLDPERGPDRPPQPQGPPPGVHLDLLAAVNAPDEGVVAPLHPRLAQVLSGAEVPELFPRQLRLVHFAHV